ncbi:MAG: hypothetical protein FKY71_11380 [Spiribacter salinus]|uniref:Uncharacterized protein n=1 Tax=Spiribacter salinus TaxID=1335746 RepID=A0A540VQ64_9GAMM|nr:MAG: hypothetical protein FKY71_11380 [Spiribacter salinus]
MSTSSEIRAAAATIVSNVLERPPDELLHIPAFVQENRRSFRTGQVRRVNNQLRTVDFEYSFSLVTAYDQGYDYAQDTIFEILAAVGEATQPRPVYVAGDIEQYEGRAAEREVIVTEITLGQTQRI